MIVMAFSNPRPIHSEAKASFHLCQRILQHDVVEAELGKQLPQSRFLIHKLPQVIHFWRRNNAIFLVPYIECGIRNSQLIADLRTDTLNSGFFREITISLRESFVLHCHHLSSGGVFHVGIQFLNSTFFQDQTHNTSIVPEESFVENDRIIYGNRSCRPFLVNVFIRYNEERFAILV